MHFCIVLSCWCELILSSVSCCRHCCSLSDGSLYIDWCCFYYFVRNSVVALLEARCAYQWLSSAVLPRFTGMLFRAREAMKYIYTFSWRALAREKSGESSVRTTSIMYMCLSLVFLNQTIWSLTQCGIIKPFDKLIEFSLWGPCTMITGFKIMCIGRVYQESEDLSDPLSMSNHQIFDQVIWHFTWFSITFATLLCAVCFRFRRWVRWQWSCWWRNVLSPCPQSHCAVAVNPHFLMFNLTGDCPSVRICIQARTAQSHMERSATHTSGRATLVLLRILRHEFFVI